MTTTLRDLFFTMAVAVAVGCDSDSPDNNDTSSVVAPPSAKDPRVVANVIPPSGDQKNWTIAGLVLENSVPVAVKTVYAIVTAKSQPNGNQLYLAPAEMGDSTNFIILATPENLNSVASGKSNSEFLITIYATLAVEGENDAKKAEATLEFGTQYVKPAIAPVAAISLVVIIILYVVGVVLGLWIRPEQAQADKWFRWKYVLSVLLALLFAIIIVVAFAMMLYFFRPDDQSQQRKPTSLGFATIYEGQYAKNLSPGLIFSLTEPPPAGQDQDIGFAAPLWVLLLSVIGSGLITITMVVNQIAAPPPFANLTSNDEDKAEKARADIRNRIRRFVEHQTFLLASPFVGIFVYLGVRESAGPDTKVLAIAVAALGAGPLLHSLLKKSQQAAHFAIARAKNKITDEDIQTPSE